jgi:hypothetical protein
MLHRAIFMLESSSIKYNMQNEVRLGEFQVLEVKLLESCKEDRIKPRHTQHSYKQNAPTYCDDKQYIMNHNQDAILHTN